MATETDSILRTISLSVGASEPAIKLLISMLIGYPLAIFYRKFVWPLPSVVSHHLFMVVTGVLICAFNFGYGIKHSGFAVCVTYLLIKVLGPGKNLKIASFVFHMGYILIGYYFYESETYDIKWTTPHCVLVLRLIGLAFDISDTAAFKKGEKIKEMDYYGIEKTPNFLELAAYVYFPGSFLVGPQFPYHLYERFINKEFAQYTAFEAAGMKRYFMGLIYLTVYQVGVFLVWDSYLLSDEFESLGYLKKILLIGVWGKLTFYKYIAIWLLSEGIATRYGLTFKGYKDADRKEEDWSALENINVGLFELATEFDHYVQSFNVNTNRWVARHIYKRLIFLGNRNLSQTITLLFLAVWHGFHSGYYVTFMFEFIIIHIDRDFACIKNRNATLKNFLSKPALHWPIFVLQKIYTIVGLGWCIIPFVFLSFGRYWRVFGHVRYFGFVYIFGYPIVRQLLRASFPPDRIKKDDVDNKKSE